MSHNLHIQKQQKTNQNILCHLGLFNSYFMNFGKWVEKVKEIKK